MVFSFRFFFVWTLRVSLLVVPRICHHMTISRGVLQVFTLIFLSIANVIDPARTGAECNWVSSLVVPNSFILCVNLSFMFIYLFFLETSLILRLSLRHKHKYKHEHNGSKNVHNSSTSTHACAEQIIALYSVPYRLDTVKQDGGQMLMLTEAGPHLT